MSKTMLEVAHILGVTKNAIKYRARQLPADMVIRNENGLLEITDEGIQAIKIAMGKEEPVQPGKETMLNQEEPLETRQKTGQENNLPTQTTIKEPVQPGKETILNQEEPLETTKRTTEEPLYAALLETVEVLKEQLQTKDQQIKTLNETLQAMTQNLGREQALHAGTMQQTVLLEKPKRKKFNWFKKSSST